MGPVGCETSLEIEMLQEAGIDATAEPVGSIA